MVLFLICVHLWLKRVSVLHEPVAAGVGLAEFAAVVGGHGFDADEAAGADMVAFPPAQGHAAAILTAGGVLDEHALRAVDGPADAAEPDVHALGHDHGIVPGGIEALFADAFAASVHDELQEGGAVGHGAADLRDAVGGANFPPHGQALEERRAAMMKTGVSFDNIPNAVPSGPGAKKTETKGRDRFKVAVKVAA